MPQLFFKKIYAPKVGIFKLLAELQVEKAEASLKGGFYPSTFRAI
jgi:hypothetical protein